MGYDPTLDFDVSCTDGDDDYVDVEEVEEYEELKSDLTCPFCFEGFDTIGLLCHIDGMHPAQTKSGICPLCETNTGTNMSAHIIKQHENSLLSSFVHDSPPADEPEIVQPSSFAGTSASGKSSGGSTLERYEQLFALDRQGSRGEGPEMQTSFQSELEQPIND
ncbi:hypothetical protein RJ639_014248 [Escallonia herrerae]|uniref:Di19 zinc-binding domain-containing protein n=1 Tax=Escallonia herrerae TaxID=1293975 RepID=A0AA88VFV3_9ASTE|nr:hypothetical protein RJ639_014248 [Escallonia herrerae]